MKPFTFIVNTQHNPPAKGSNLQAINTHCASFAHKKRQQKWQESRISTQRPARRTLIQKKKDVLKDEGCSPRLDSPTNSSKTSTPRRSMCPACERDCRSPGVCPHMHDFDAQLCSVLDPFSCLPLRLSRQEQKLLQEFLTNDKTLVYGTAVGPQQICFTRAYSRSNVPWSSKLHLLAHIIMAEAPMVKYNGISSTFYLRRAQIYETMNENLSSEEVSFRDKIVSFLTLSLIETSLCKFDLQAKHVTALHHFIEDNGGMTRALSELCPANLADDLPGILIQHISENVPILDASSLEDSIACLTRALRNSAEWAVNISQAEESELMFASWSQTSQRPFPKLRRYLTYLINFLRREDLHSRVPLGIVHCTFGNLLLHQAMYGYDASTSLQFLEGLEACMAANDTSKRCEVLFSNIFWVKGVSQTSLLNSVHSKISEPVKVNEIQILEATYAALRSIAFLSPALRGKLEQNICKCIFAAVKPVPAEIMNEDFLQLIAEDIRDNWITTKIMEDVT